MSENTIIQGIKMRHSTNSALRIGFAVLLNFAAFSFALAEEKGPPNAVEIKGSKDIQSVRLIGATSEYDHPIFGSPVEATGIEVKTKDGTTLQYLTGPDSLFEDREVRLADLDGDGRDEMIVVHTYIAKGASLAVFSIEDGKIKLKAETPPLGGPHRWLNPAGIASFISSAGKQIALVRMPHAVGQLQLWSYRYGKLSLEKTVDDVSNHKFGSLNRHLAAVAEFDAPGSQNLLIPSFDRNSVRVISFSAGDVKSAIFSAGGEITGDAIVVRSSFPAFIKWPLSDGRQFVLKSLD